MMDIQRIVVIDPQKIRHLSRHISSSSWVSRLGETALVKRRQEGNVKKGEIPGLLWLKKHGFFPSLT